MFNVSGEIGRLHHAAHATHTGVHRHFGLVFLLLDDDTFRCQEHACDRSGVLQRYTSNLGGVYHACCMQVLVHVGTCVVAEVTLAFTNLLNNHSAFLALAQI